MPRSPHRNMRSPLTIWRSPSTVQLGFLSSLKKSRMGPTETLHLWLRTAGHQSQQVLQEHHNKGPLQVRTLLSWHQSVNPSRTSPLLPVWFLHPTAKTLYGLFAVRDSTQTYSYRLTVTGYSFVWATTSVATATTTARARPGTGHSRLPKSHSWTNS